MALARFQSKPVCNETVLWKKTHEHLLGSEIKHDCHGNHEFLRNQGRVWQLGLPEDSILSYYSYCHRCCHRCTMVARVRFERFSLPKSPSVFAGGGGYTEMMERENVWNKRKGGEKWFIWHCESDNLATGLSSVTCRVFSHDKFAYAAVTNTPHFQKCK